MDSKLLKLQECYRFLNCDLASRCSNEGEAVLNAKHLIAWGRLESTDVGIVKTLALCLKTSELTDTPHEIHGTFRINKPDIEVSEVRCSCKAGESEKCKHIAAFLLLCTRNSILEFEQFSCTDVKCYWKSQKGASLQQYAPEPFKEWPCIPRKSVDSTEDGIDCNFFTTFVANRLPNSALGLHSVGRRDIVPPDVHASQFDVSEVEWKLQAVINCAVESPFLASLDINAAAFNLKNCCQNVLDGLADVRVIDIAIKTKNQIEQWRFERRYRLTGARCYAIFTYSKNNWQKKAQDHFWPKPFTNKYVRHGINHEKEALMSYKTKNRYDVYEPGFIVCEKYPWLGYTPDAVVLDTDGKQIKLVEIKCPYIGIQEPAINFIHTCKFLKLTPAVLVLKQRHKYYAQVQLGMAILNIKETDFIIYSTSSQSFLNILVHFDDVFTRTMLTKITNNYFNYMIHFVCEKENVEINTT